jgi:hypothetical protein
MLDVVCWRWAPPQGYRSEFGPETVNTLAAMVRRHYRKPHRFSVITDDPRGYDRRIRVIPLWDDFADMKSPHGAGNPSCYRRLKMFSAEARDIIGPRFVSLDLDSVITADMAPVWDRPEEIVLWGDTNPSTHYNGSMVLMTAGARRRVWDDFDPSSSPGKAKRAGQFGSDQAWISYRLGGGEAKWTTRDGVYSYRNHLRTTQALPGDCRIVMFHGLYDPWHPHAQAKAWVREHYVGETDVASVNLSRRLAVLTDGETVPVTQMFDADGDDTDDPAQAAAFVAGRPGKWFSCATKVF